MHKHDAEDTTNYLLSLGIATHYSNSRIRCERIRPDKYLIYFYHHAVVLRSDFERCWLRAHGTLQIMS